MSSSEHTHQLSDGQLICDNEQCREKVLNEIKEIENDFNEIVENNSKNNQINKSQGWKIINLTSEKLSQKLILHFNKQEIDDVIQNFIEQSHTKQQFEKIFKQEKKPKSKKFITEKQLWDFYINICKSAIEILSKTKKDRQIHVKNFLSFDENSL